MTKSLGVLLVLLAACGAAHAQLPRLGDQLPEPVAPHEPVPPMGFQLVTEVAVPGPLPGSAPVLRADGAALAVE
ncbi:MAG TPA: hypothetical protein VJS92_04395, partial [Candidatus Polarisedimenticolaceae bacterium]|nr:hypothetical protein [Candidatus Polarisedimenticolaceae bacterium]